jgi:hypothetical protein
MPEKHIATTVKPTQAEQAEQADPGKKKLIQQINTNTKLNPTEIEAIVN